MQSPQIKKITINIITGAIIVGTFVIGYWVFFLDGSEEKEIPADATRVSQVIMVGVEIERTLRELGDLERSIKSSKDIFDIPVFKGLEDFSVQVPTENIGRENPFTRTTWKISQEAQTAKSNAQ